MAGVWLVPIWHSSAELTQRRDNLAKETLAVGKSRRSTDHLQGRSPIVVSAMHRTALALLVLVLLPSCSANRGRPRADGSYVIDCSEEKTCLSRAKSTCGEEGYTLLGGKNNKKKYGAPGNEIYIGKSEIYVRCNRDRPADAPDPATGEWSLRRPDEATQNASPKPPVTAAGAATAERAERVCKPGETQRCFGPGACEGGQACLPDGKGFSACDCGSKQSGANPSGGDGEKGNVPAAAAPSH